MPEYKSLPNAIKAVDDRTVVGIASVFGNVDSYGDVIWPGAYSKTLQERGGKLKHFWSHLWDTPPIAKVIGAREVGREELPQAVLDMAPNALGGLEVTREYLDTDRANEVLTGIKAGTITEMSIGYDAIKFDFEERENERVRNLREVKLYETSDVVWGANDATTTSKLFVPDLITLLRYVEHHMKAGARHSSADIKALNAIHKAVIDLGCTTCKGIIEEEDEGKSRADIPSLTLLRTRLQELELGVLSL